MILIDRAVGSKELEDPLRKLGLPVEKTHLEFGDIAFMGRGEKGEGLFIGIELKKIGELVTSLRTKRFQGHQLIGLTRDFDRRYLLIEGDFHHNAKGAATLPAKGKSIRLLRGAPSAMQLEQELLNIQTRGGCWLRHTTSRRDTLRFIAAAYRYWTDKDLDDHKSHMAVYAPDLDRGLLNPPTDFRRALVVLLPGIGFAVSKRVEEECGGSFRALMLWPEKRWAELQTFDKHGKPRKLGASRARGIIKALR